MQAFDFQLRPRVVFGAGVIEQLGTLAVEHGARNDERRRSLFVAGKKGEGRELPSHPLHDAVVTRQVVDVARGRCDETREGILVHDVVGPLDVQQAGCIEGVFDEAFLHCQAPPGA